MSEDARFYKPEPARYISETDDCEEKVASHQYFHFNNGGVNMSLRILDGEFFHAISESGDQETGIYFVLSQQHVHFGVPSGKAELYITSREMYDWLQTRLNAIDRETLPEVQFHQIKY